MYPLFFSACSFRLRLPRLIAWNVLICLESYSELEVPRTQAHAPRPCSLRDCSHSRPHERPTAATHTRLHALTDVAFAAHLTSSSSACALDYHGTHVPVCARDCRTLRVHTIAVRVQLLRKARARPARKPYRGTRA